MGGVKEQKVHLIDYEVEIAGVERDLDALITILELARQRDKDVLRKTIQTVETRLRERGQKPIDLSGKELLVGPCVNCRDEGQTVFPVRNCDMCGDEICAEHSYPYKDVGVPGVEVVCRECVCK